MPAEEHITYVPESSGVDSRVVIWAAVAALLLLALAVAGLSVVYQDAVAVKTVQKPQQFPKPRVVTSQDESAERRDLTLEQSRRLESWGWANNRHTLVQVPIERAMKLLVQKGADAYAPLQPPQPALSAPTAGAQNATTPNPQASSNPSLPEQRP